MRCLVTDNGSVTERASNPGFPSSVIPGTVSTTTGIGTPQCAVMGTSSLHTLVTLIGFMGSAGVWKLSSRETTVLERIGVNVI